MTTSRIVSLNWGKICAVAAHPGPWTIRADVAWSGDDEVYVLPLRPPYTALPWALSGSAAMIWRALAAGAAMPDIVAAFDEDADPKQVASGVADFVAELSRLDLIDPQPINPAPSVAESV